MNVSNYLDSVVFRHPDKVALKFEGKSLTYKEFSDRICKLGNGLRSMGVDKGDRVAMLCHNSSNYLEIYFACAKIGAISEQMNWRQSRQELLNIIEESSAKVLFVSRFSPEDIDYIIARLSRKIEVIVLEKCDTRYIYYEDFLEGQESTCITANTKGDDPCTMFYTSGTSGKAKGVILTHKNIIIHSMVCMMEMRCKEEDVWFNVLPLFHSSSSGLHPHLFVGATVIIVDHFEPENFLKMLETERVTRGCLVPPMLDWLLRAPNIDQVDLSSIEMIAYAGSPMPAQLLKKTLDRIGCDFYQFYGMTEMSPVVSILKPKEHVIAAQAGKGSISVGKPVLGTRIKIVDEDGNECSRMEAGEIVARSDTMMKGYTDPELTADAIRDGWFYTGDIGYLDNDNYLHLVDRKNNLIISGGENIYASEVEECIRKMTGLVREVAVVGVPNDRWGEMVSAVIVKEDAAEIDEKSVIDFCKARISSYKCPKRVVFWDSIPHNESGKVLKKEVIRLISGE